MRDFTGSDEEQRGAKCAFIRKWGYDRYEQLVKRTFDRKYNPPKSQQQ